MTVWAEAVRSAAIGLSLFDVGLILVAFSIKTRVVFWHLAPFAAALIGYLLLAVLELRHGPADQVNFDTVASMALAMGCAFGFSTVCAWRWRVRRTMREADAHLIEEMRRVATLDAERSLRDNGAAREPHSS